MHQSPLSLFLLLNSKKPQYKPTPCSLPSTLTKLSPYLPPMATTVEVQSVTAALPENCPVNHDHMQAQQEQSTAKNVVDEVPTKEGEKIEAVIDELIAREFEAKVTPTDEVVATKEEEEQKEEAKEKSEERQDSSKRELSPDQAAAAAVPDLAIVVPADTKASEEAIDEAKEDADKVKAVDHEVNNNEESNSEVA